ncbi:MAG TPA: hypothetical protein VIV40_09830 [Kofleriaceae bacterium]
MIEREMYRAREDLETNLAELKHVVQEKIDIKARAKVAVEKGKLMAADVLERGKDGAQQLYKRGEDRAYFTYLKAKDRPVLTASIIGGVVAAGVLIYVGRRNDWW